MIRLPGPGHDPIVIDESAIADSVQFRMVAGARGWAPIRVRCPECGVANFDTLEAAHRYARDHRRGEA